MTLTEMPEALREMATKHQSLRTASRWKKPDDGDARQDLQKIEATIREYCEQNGLASFFLEILRMLYT
jgi:surfactin synthase thioesterase subunit